MNPLAKRNATAAGLPLAGALVLGGAMLAGLATRPGTVPVVGSSEGASMATAPSLFDSLQRWASSTTEPMAAVPPAFPAEPRMAAAPPAFVQPWAAPTAPTPAVVPTWTPPRGRAAPNLMVTGGLGAGPRPGCTNAGTGLGPYALPAGGRALSAPPLRPDPVAVAPSTGAQGPTARITAPILSGPILPFQEAHWQGLELLPKTRTLAKLLGLPPDAQGVIVDEATMPSDDAGFLAGDLVTAVGGEPTPDLFAFIDATSKVRALPRIDIDIYRKLQPMRLVLTALMGRLGTANGETAQTIPPGSRPPHAYQGACTNCHRIGTKGQLPTDQGDVLTKTAPVISAGQRAPHVERGTCSACHTIRPTAAGAQP